MIFRDEEVYQTFSLWLHNYRLYRQTVRYIFIAILLSILVLEAYIRLWLRIRLFGVIYQICELFLILWTLLCKEWNCEFWLPKDILGDIPHALVIWREIINNFLLLMDFPSCRIVILFSKKVLFLLGQVFRRGTRLRLGHFDIMCMQTEILLWTISSPWKITILTFLRGERHVKQKGGSRR